MQPDSISAMRKVISAIEDSDLLTPLSHINLATRAEDASDFVPLLLSSFGEFHGSAKGFGNQEKRVCEVMKLDSLFDDVLWQGLVQRPVIDPYQLVQLHDMHTRVHFAVNYLPDLISLSEERDLSSKNVPEDKSVLALGVRTMAAAEGVDTSQLSHALHGLELIYVACCAMNAVEPGQIIVQNWRGHPMPMFSVLVDKSARTGIDSVFKALVDVVSEHQGHRSRTTLTDALIASPVFQQLEAISEAGVLDARSHDETAELLLDGCLELLSASVIPPGLPLAMQVKLDTLSVIAEHELREHLQAADTDGSDDAAAPAETGGEVVMLRRGDDHSDDPDGESAFADAHEADGDDDGLYADQPSLGHPSDLDAMNDSELVQYDGYDDPDDALQIVVEMDGEPVEYEAETELESEAESAEPGPDVEYVEPEIVTNKAFKRALKDLRKGRRR